MLYLGDVLRGTTVDFIWNSFNSSGASVTRTVNGTISVYKGNNTTQTTTGVTDTEDFDTLTGIHHCRVVTTDAFYVPHENYMVVLSAATIDGQTVNAVLAHFSIENRMQAGLIRRGVLTGGAAQSATLDTGASATDDKYVGGVLINTTELEARVITDYVGTTKVATMDRAWVAAAANLDTFEVYAGSLPQTSEELSAAAADKLLGRTISGGADGGRTVESALATIRNKVVIDRNGNTITVYDTDDTTVLWSGTIATATGNPLSTVDPS